jgi:hypothetical protein
MKKEKPVVERKGGGRGRCWKWPIEEFPIEDGIPKDPQLYPFDKMKPGQSFLVPNSAQGEHARAAAARYAKKHGGRFSSRTTEQGVRIFRDE